MVTTSRDRKAAPQDQTRPALTDGVTLRSSLAARTPPQVLPPQAFSRSARLPLRLVEEFFWGWHVF